MALGDSFQTPAEGLAYEDFMNKNVTSRGLSVLYYSRSQSGMTKTDELQLGDLTSAKEHSLKVVCSGQSQELPNVFQLKHK